MFISMLYHTNDKKLVIPAECCLYSNTAVLKQDFSIIRKSLVERGQQFLRNASLSRDKIARLGSPFITDGAVSCLRLYLVRG